MDETKVINLSSSFLILERWGEAIEVRRSDGSVMVRFENFEGIAIVDGPTEAKRRENVYTFRSEE